MLSIWWRRLTAFGAIAGLITGGVLASVAVLVTVVGEPLPGWPGALLGQPAAQTVPLAFAAMVVGSLLTPSRIPPGVIRTMVRLHAPEGIDVDRREHPARRPA